LIGQLIEAIPAQDGRFTYPARDAARLLRRTLAPWRIILPACAAIFVPP
jgi:hypothetical protein